jgi:drug/metabolite transporter (DMT)-like permease
MKKGYDLMQGVGAVLTLVGAMLQITRWEFSPYLYILGTFLFAYTQVMDRYEGKNLIIRRLRRQQILGAALLVFAGVLMLVTHNNEWVLCLTIAAIIELYTAFRIPNELEKEK